MTLPIPKEGLDLVKEFEGFHKLVSTDTVKPYLCSAKVPTIGYGTTYYMNGTKVKINDPVMHRSEAEGILDKQLLSYVGAIDRGVTVPIATLMRASLGSWCYNVGKGAWKSSTLRRKLNRGDYVGVLKEFPKWRIAAGQVSPGLVRRRAAEAALFQQGIASMSSGPSVDAVPLPDRGAIASKPWYRSLLNWIWS